MRLASDGSSRSRPRRPGAGGGLAAGADLPVVLVVEDDVEISAQLCDLLRYRGLDPRPAYQGPEAVQLFLQTRPQAIVLDLMLPYMNGVQVLERIRRLPGGAGIPVVAISAVYQDARVFERELQRLGVRDFLAKPFSLFVLADRLDSFLDRGPSPPPPAKADPADDSAVEPVSYSGLAPPGPGPTDEVGEDPVADALAAGGEIDLEVDRTDTLRLLGGLAVGGCSGQATVEPGRDDVVHLSLREGAVARAWTEEPHLTWERLRVLPAFEREVAVERILGGLLGGSRSRVVFLPSPVAASAADAREADLLRALYEAGTRAFDFNAVADDVSRWVGWVPVGRPQFESMVARLRLTPPLDGLPRLMRDRRTVESLYNAMGERSPDLVRLIWTLERVGLLEYARR
ncbi:response regulator [Myxococcota bacterium]|nr:response regulator [Myxococcota bacterium]